MNTATYNYYVRELRLTLDVTACLDICVREAMSHNMSISVSEL